MLKVTHNAGFFSCCSVRLEQIVNYLNNQRILPEVVDSSQQFHLYKNKKYDCDNENEVVFEFFEHYNKIDCLIEFNKPITINNMCFQFDNYKKVNFTYINPFIKKYFTPSLYIQNISNELIKKYHIDINNCVAIYYRGTDKKQETELGSFDTYYEKLKEILKIKNNLSILIQTDSSDFLNYMVDKLKNFNTSNQIIIISENTTSSTDKGIHNEKKRSENFEDMKILLASFLIISKCKYIICSSGNCSIWMMFFRGNANNVYQNLNREWL